jgi:Fe-S-cluster-containing dehydrogenase component
MAITRREAFKNLAKGSIGLPILAAALPAVAHAEEEAPMPKNALGMLYDATKCVGCKSCMVACSQANNLPPDTRIDGLHQAPPALNSFTKNIIKLYRTADGSDHSYFKQQCMHCADPACVTACMFGGLRKEKDTGIVWWLGSKCVGCRYCEVACPFHIPTFTWDGFNPKIVKCELCRERLAKGQEPGCTTVCPTQAVIYGHRDQLLAEAKRRIAANPGRYFENRVYGENDGGGTQVLYLSRVGFDKIGLPSLSENSIPSGLKYSHMLYKWMALPVAIFAGMAIFANKNFKDHAHHLVEDQKKTGLRPQL